MYSTTTLRIISDVCSDVQQENFPHEHSLPLAAGFREKERKRKKFCLENNLGEARGQKLVENIWLDLPAISRDVDRSRQLPERFEQSDENPPWQ